MQLRLVGYAAAVVALQFACSSSSSVVAAAPSSATSVDSLTAPESDAQVSNTRLRGLLNKLTGTAQGGNADATADAAATADVLTPPPVKEIVVRWQPSSTASPDTSDLVPIEQIAGDEAIVVFYDRSLHPEASAESAVVTFDVRSRANCVVSVCGLQRNWYMRNEERCFDLRIAQKSSDEAQNGLIRGISAAYSSLRPVASKLYLKFDATNFIDGSACEYAITSGSKTVSVEAVAAAEGAAAAMS